MLHSMQWIIREREMNHYNELICLVGGKREYGQGGISGKTEVIVCPSSLHLHEIHSLLSPLSFKQKGIGHKTTGYYWHHQFSFPVTRAVFMYLFY